MTRIYVRAALSPVRDAIPGVLIDVLHADARALPVPLPEISVPLHVLTGEAIDVAGFFKRYYEPELAPKTKVVLRPGLASVRKNKLSPNADKRITLLVDEVQAAQTQYQLSAEVGSTYERRSRAARRRAAEKAEAKPK